MNKRTYYITTENGQTIVTKQRRENARTVRARSIREATIKGRILADRDFENLRVSKRANQTVIGSAMLNAFGADFLGAIRRR